MKKIGKLFLVLVIGVPLMFGIFMYNTETRYNISTEEPIITQRLLDKEGTLSYLVNPTENTLADTDYAFVVDNSVWSWVFNVSWSQLELNIGKPKMVSRVLTPDELIAFNMNGYYPVTHYTVDKAHNPVWLFITSFPALALGTLYIKKKKLFKRKRSVIAPFNSTGTIARDYEKIRNPELCVVRDSIVDALRMMDSTRRYYVDEDEANRELVSCLKMRGYDAVYQHYLGNGRTCDAFTSNTIIEGKLDPNQADIDRLLGQLNDYYKTNSNIAIVLYGNVADTKALVRISEIVRTDPNRLALVYLDRPQRVRLSKTSVAKEELY